MAGIGLEATPPMCSPLMKTTLYKFVHAHEPVFFIRQTFTNVWLGAITVPSGMVTSVTTVARSQSENGVDVKVSGASIMDVGGKEVI